MIVLDASVVLAALFDEEHAEAAQAVIARSSGALAAPTLILFEIANALRSAVKRRRLEVSLARDLAECAEELLAHFDLAAGPASVVELHEASAAWEVTPYDAAYIKLAVTTRAPLASFDRAMRATAERLGIVVLP